MKRNRKEEYISILIKSYSLVYPSFFQAQSTCFRELRNKREGFFSRTSLSFITSPSVKGNGLLFFLTFSLQVFDYFVQHLVCICKKEHDDSPLLMCFYIMPKLRCYSLITCVQVRQRYSSNSVKSNSPEDTPAIRE